MSHVVYILTCADGTLYTGSTNNLERRVWQHNNSKKGAKYTSGRRPVRLVWSQKCRTVGQALRREREIKVMSRKEKLRLIKNV